MEKDEKIIKELGSHPDDYLYTVEKSFFLKTVDGPLALISKGDIVRLSRETAGPLFVEERVLPVSLPEVGGYMAIRNFIHVDDGKWALIERRDVLKLSLDEALPLLREFKVRLIDELKGGKNEVEGD